MDKKKLTGNCVLLLTALIWGSAFVAQRVGMDYVGPFTFCFVRFTLSALILLPVIYFMNLSKKKKIAAADLAGAPAALTGEMNSDHQALAKQKKKTFYKAGLICGTVLFCGAILQQYGMVFTTAGKAGFITALYIVLVPVFGLALKHRPGIKAWAGVAFGAVGLYMLCITESFTIQRGDFIVLIGACFWAAHLLVIDHFLPQIEDPIKLSFAQFFVCACYCGIAAFLAEEISIQAILRCAVPLLYAGILSGGVGFTLQIIGQKYTAPTVASLLLSMESVFAAVFGFLILGELMSGRELFGCGLMFAAIVISQLPNRRSAERLSQ